jgi:hypothetical protein
MKVLVAVATLALIAAPSFSAACRDEKGKFIECPPAAAPAAARCKDAKGKFAKCTAAAQLS